MRTCLEIGAKAAAEKKRFTLAIIYDELCRREWNQKATRGKLHLCASYTATYSAYAFCAQGDKDFDVNQASLVKDKDILDRARIALTAASSGKGKQ